MSELLKMNEQSLVKRARENNRAALLKAADMAIRKYREAARNNKSLSKPGAKVPQLQYGIDSIASLKLKQATEYRLLKAGICTVPQLMQMDKEALMKIHTLGNKGVKEILEKLKNREEAVQVKNQLWERKAAKKARHKA